MKYYKVKADYDGFYNNKISLVADELFTKCELIKHKIPMYAVNKVEISMAEIYFMFGCRFSNLEGEMEFANENLIYDCGLLEYYNEYKNSNQLEIWR